MQLFKWEECSEELQKKLLSRPALQVCAVNQIVDQVKRVGDAACMQFTVKFDGVQLSSLRVPSQAIAEAKVNVEVAQALEVAMMTIMRMQTAIMPKDITVETLPGVSCQRVAQPIDSVGLYVPGGSAPLVSTVMMLALPAKIAGCPEIVMCTPTNRAGQVDAAILYAAKLCGITQIFALGGAQAIAAMAYGTESIPKVNKIFGPGNAWVTAAKQLVAQDPDGAAIDIPAGPSELMVIADEYADSETIAADLLSQAEHATDAQVMVCTNSAILAEEINAQLQRQLRVLPRKDIVQAALSNSRIILVSELRDAIKIANTYAPEHLSFQCENVDVWIAQLRNIGTIFAGKNAAETFGDYITGSNHVLPTYGYARAVSGLSVADYMRFTTVQRLDDAAIKNLGQYTVTLAELEGLQAHANAVKIRLQQQELKI